MDIDENNTTRHLNFHRHIPNSGHIHITIVLLVPIGLLVSKSL